MSRILPFFRAALALLLGCGALRAATDPADSADELRPGEPTVVFVAPGRATTVQFRTADKVAAISLASPVVRYKYDKALNQLEITPAVSAGGVETNLNLRIGPDVYILLVKVVGDVRAQFLRSFTLAGDQRIGVFHRRHQARHALLDQQAGARRGAAVMAAGLQGHVHG